LFGSSSVNELGDYRIDTTIGLLQGGETVLPKVSFTLTEENVNATQTNIGTQTKIEAESFDGQKGIKTAACSEGGKYVGWINDNDYIMFEGVDFGFQPNQFQARVASAFSGGSIQVRLGSKSGEKIGTCSVPGTNGWQNWETVTCNIGPVSGEHDLYLVFKGSDYGLFNINWFIFAR
jgi:hypothetical protein